MVATKKSKQASKLLKVLEKRYGKKPVPPGWSAIDTLLFYMIYYYSGVTAARRALKAFREEYVDLNEVRVSSLNEIRATLRSAGASEEVAHPLREMLKQVFMRENEVSLETLNELGIDQAKRHLAQFDSLPSHSTDYLLLVRWNHSVLPVDERVAAMASRLGLAQTAATPAQVQKTLMRNVKAASYFDFYTLFLEHATKICTEKPRCGRCMLIKHCKHGKTASSKKNK